MSGDPSGVGDTGVAVAGREAEGALRRTHGEEQVAARGVHDSLGSARRPARVEDKHAVLGIHLRAGAVRPLIRHQFGHLDVSPVHPSRNRSLLSAVSGVIEHKDVLHDVPAAVPVEGRVADLLEGEGPSAPHAAVGGADPLRPGGRHPFGDGVRGKSREDDGVDGADPGARQHHHRGLRDHGHVEGHDVTPADAGGEERVGDAAHAGEEFGVADLFAVARLVPFPHQRRRGAVAGVHVAVDAVVAGVQLAAEEPSDAPIFEAAGRNRVVRAGPVEVRFCEGVPVCGRVRHRKSVLRLVRIKGSRGVGGVRFLQP
mmetsp:Transcript_38629/g.75358  ORF Transcript_38629/g.75358 Transcript_38629/m.75358 type:complete len:314 (-) Transcript_38629:73-1014(-)